MKSFSSKELLCLIAGEFLSLFIIIWLMYQVPRSPATESLSTALIDYGVYGWLWFFVLSFSVVTLIALIICRIRKNTDLTHKYTRLSVLLANVSIAASLFLAASLQWNKLFIEASWKLMIDSYCVMIILTGSGIALIEYLACAIISFFNIEHD
ncbi:MAG: hypothetical protein JW787_15470 [Sedimentisphaerales bacterium]|nr:hypothetical protein [Sedimentisphaerales bacterium]